MINLEVPLWTQNLFYLKSKNKHKNTPHILQHYAIYQ